MKYRNLLLAYADDVNLIGVDRNSIKTNYGALSDKYKYI